MRLRPLSMTAGLALAASALVAVPSAAQADAVTLAQIGVQRQVSDTGPAVCTVLNSGSSSLAPYTSNGVTVTQSVNGSSTLTDNGDAGDTTTVDSSVVGKVRASESGGQLTSVDIDATIAATITAAQGIGTDCDAEASSTVLVAYQTVQSAARWVTIEADLPTHTLAQVTFQRTAPADPEVFQVVALVGTAKGHHKAQVLLPAGTYQVQSTMQHSLTAPSLAGQPTSVTVTPSIDITYSAVGSATSKAAGDGTSYARFKDALDCATGQLKGKFLKAAGPKKKRALKKAVFKAGGVKKVVKKPKKGGKITLKGLPTSDDVAVKAVFKLVGGGKKTFTQTFRSCT